MEMERGMLVEENRAYLKHPILSALAEAIHQGGGMLPGTASELFEQRHSAFILGRLNDDAAALERKQLLNRGDVMTYSRLRKIISKRELHAIFQPILNMRRGEIIGYEGLIRGPKDSPLHLPNDLFDAARSCNLMTELERVCRSVVIERFVELSLPGKLFLNVSPDSLCQPFECYRETLANLQDRKMTPTNVIIELTENQPTFDYGRMREAARHYRDMGFQIAIDDLGEGFASLRLWSELRPDYVKIDRHFIQGINQDIVKLQFVRSIYEIAAATGSQVIAEGIETQKEMMLVKSFGIHLGQGYHIARPDSDPPREVSAEIAATISRKELAVYPYEKITVCPQQPPLTKILRPVPPVAPNMTNNQILDLLVRQPDLQALAVVEQGKPIGLITRAGMIDRFARQYQRELFGAKSCLTFMDAEPLVVDKSVSLQDLSQIMVNADSRHLSNGFIITENGCYVGTGTGHDLMREITQMQINAARYANPLTLLPGSVPINEHMDRLLAGNRPFCLCYFDIDHFKPFNDVYGYRKGDEIIQMTGRILLSQANPDVDMVGHVGGDDFIIVFQSEDWERRCHAMLSSFSEAVTVFYQADDVARGGYVSEDRRGKRVFHSLASLSIGAVKVGSGQYGSTYHVASAASDAKKQAKKIVGNSLFIERRGDTIAD